MEPASVRHGPAGGAVPARQGRPAHRRGDAAARRGPRGVHGLVRPRAVVARAEHVAGPDAVHAGPVRRAGRRPPPLHAHAQDRARAAPRPALLRHQGGLLRQDVHGCRPAVQGTGHPARRGAVPEQAPGAPAPQVQPQGQEDSERRAPHQRARAAARGHQHLHRDQLAGRLQRQPGQALPLRARHPHALAHLHAHQLPAGHEPEHPEAKRPERVVRAAQRPPQRHPRVAEWEPGRIPRPEPRHPQSGGTLAHRPAQVPHRASTDERGVA